MVCEEMVKGGRVDIEGEDLCAGFVEGREVVAKLFRVLVEGGGDEVAQLLREGHRAAAPERHRKDVGGHC